MRQSCIDLLTAGDFDTDDLRFLFVLITMAVATRPGAFPERLRTSAVAAKRSPESS